MPIVIDQGSGFIKAGFAGEDTPYVQFHNAIGIPNGNDYRCIKPIYIGDEAHSKRNGLEMHYPIQYGEVTNWDKMSRILHHTLHSELNVQGKDHPIMIADSAWHQRPKIIQQFFEKFEVPSFFIALQPVLALYATGRTTGIGIESGDSLTQFVPCYDGCAIRHAALSLNIGGKRLTEYMRLLLVQEGHFFSQVAEYQIIKNIKEKLAYVAREQEVSNQEENQTFELPDGIMISVSNACQCPEAMFQPGHLGMPDNGLSDLAFRAIQMCDFDIQKVLYSNISLSGGNSMFHGMEQRLHQELSMYAPQSMKVRVLAVPNRKHLAWIGGSIFASMSTFKHSCISKQEYEENGPEIVRRKCL